MPAESSFTLPETNISPENRPSQKETIVFKPSIFRCELLLVSGRVYILDSFPTSQKKKKTKLGGVLSKQRSSTMPYLPPASSSNTGGTTGSTRGGLKEWLCHKERTAKACRLFRSTKSTPNFHKDLWKGNVSWVSWVHEFVFVGFPQNQLEKGLLSHVTLWIEKPWRAQKAPWKMCFFEVSLKRSQVLRSPFGRV